MQLKDLSASELAVLKKLAQKWARKHPAFGHVVAAELAREEVRRAGYQQPTQPMKLPALPRQELARLVWSLVWTACDPGSGMKGRVGHVALALARDLIDSALEVGLSEGHGLGAAHGQQ